MLEFNLSTLDSAFFETIWLTIKLSFISTLILIPIGILLGAYIAQKDTKLRLVVETLTWMPLALPPTVLGFYFLVAFSPQSLFGKFLNHLNIELAFSFSGLVVASIVYSLPFMVNPIKSGLKEIPSYYKEVSYTLGKGRIYTFFKVLLPNIKPNLILGITTSFAHTLGEFGVVSMISGDRPGSTRVASIAIFTETDAGNFATANAYAFILLIISFILLLVVIYFTKKSGKKGRL
ncbi:molybdate ABC transporter permease subunit [Helicobacter sp. 11S02629-2]|uniref:molybdate ABC transporter permease subunit n=1 Tax=Helicobacter sp. 11S02629-2 TaxID=1476195 RepID=UPI000BA64E8C|nr:molybdate ABC transporter permease subunit [Helicobacter sp. 11S02629-2]PAF45732.1 molybdenum ABC transporter permease subunit [Helicobacter sp. 11S02629-2]